MGSPYWPTQDEVRKCIRTEAEELTDATVLAVHEPMNFLRVAARNSAQESVSEEDVLKHLISNNRPIPIIGESGFGKSHVIRWLDIQLRSRNIPEWHVVRIGKNASLRQALKTLLHGLEGSEFEDARNKIDSVGTRLKVPDLARHLAVFVGSTLDSRARENEELMRRLQQIPEEDWEVTPVEVEEIKMIRRQTSNRGLQSLLNDQFFQRGLVEEGKPFYQIAKRLIEGSSEEEIDAQEFEVHESDFELSAAIGNLSQVARQYVQRSQLSTREDRRMEAVRLVNECLGEASRIAFQQLFQFSGGTFQDLFTQIRHKLHQAGKTLFVLVEDMAAISAIEDVLIDSLMQEEVRGGEEVLCPLHSAIAVTTGYAGYTRRRDTLHTRAGYEWRIETHGETRQQVLDRIKDFCGRYLNAARHGESNLASSLAKSAAAADWPGIWHDENVESKRIAEVFGDSPRGFPLFPFTEHALEALAERYCVSHQQLEFNPRTILRHILREPLLNFRDMYKNGLFPPEDFVGIICPAALKAELRRRLGTENAGRHETLAAIWGNGTTNLAQLAYQVPAEVASEFGLTELAEALDKSTREPPEQYEDPDRLKGRPDGDSESKKQERRKVVQSRDISGEVDNYFEKRSIPQAEANKVRKALVEAIEDRKDDLSSWYCMKSWPTLKRGPLYLVEVAFNKNNPTVTRLQFGSEREFQDRDQSLKYSSFIVAVLRRAEASESERESWLYNGGTEDYCNYKNFLDWWIPLQMERLVATHRSESDDLLKKQVTKSSVLDPLIGNRSLQERLELLVTPHRTLEERINLTTGLTDWDQFLAQHFETWNSEQANWLDRFSVNRYALEGDLVKSHLRAQGDLVVSVAAQQAAKRAAADLSRKYPSLRLMVDCSNHEEFLVVLRALKDLVERLNSADQFRGMEGVTTARKFLNRVEKLIHIEGWESIKSALRLLGEFSPADFIRALHSLDITSLEKLDEVLNIWDVYFQKNFQRIVNANEEAGGARRREAEQTFERLLDGCSGLIANQGETLT